MEYVIVEHLLPKPLALICCFNSLHLLGGFPRLSCVQTCYSKAKKKKGQNYSPLLKQEQSNIFQNKATLYFSRLVDLLLQIQSRNVDLRRKIQAKLLHWWAGNEFMEHDINVRLRGKEKWNTINYQICRRVID